MEKARKQMRMLTVSEASNYGRKTAPMLRIQGLWFQKLGFNVGDPVLVQCEEGKLIITQDSLNSTDSRITNLCFRKTG